MDWSSEQEGIETGTGIGDSGEGAQDWEIDLERIGRVVGSARCLVRLVQATEEIEEGSLIRLIESRCKASLHSSA